MIIKKIVTLYFSPRSKINSFSVFNQFYTYLYFYFIFPGLGYHWKVKALFSYHLSHIHHIFTAK